MFFVFQCLSGTTWMAAILHLLITPSDIEKDIFSVLPNHTVKFLEVTEASTRLIEHIEIMPSPRMIKSHLPYSFLQKPISDMQVKIIVVLRNPKDTVVSFYHFYRMNASFGNYSGTWDEFFDAFMSDRLIYGGWFDYTRTYWSLRKQANVLLVMFEDMKDELTKVIKQVASFIGKDLSTEHAQKIAEMTSFASMKKKIEPMFANHQVFNTKISPFIRKGEVGDWKNYFTVAQNEIFDKVYKDKMKGSGLEFRFE